MTKYIVCALNTGTWGQDPYNHYPRVFNTREEALQYLEDCWSVVDQDSLNPELDSGIYEDFLTIYFDDNSCSVYQVFEVKI